MSIHVVVSPGEHAFVTSQGHAQFRLALLTKNVILIGAAAGELHVGLDNALRSRSCSLWAVTRATSAQLRGAQ